MRRDASPILLSIPFDFAKALSEYNNDIFQHVLGYIFNQEAREIFKFHQT